MAARLAAKWQRNVRWWRRDNSNDRRAADALSRTHWIQTPVAASDREPCQGRQGQDRSDRVVVDGGDERRRRAVPAAPRTSAPPAFLWSGDRCRQSRYRWSGGAGRARTL